MTVSATAAVSALMQSHSMMPLAGVQLTEALLDGAPAHPVPKAKSPVIDSHNHTTVNASNVDQLIAEMDRSLQFPGVSNAWTMPIKTRIDMLATGIKTPKDLEGKRVAMSPGDPARAGQCRPTDARVGRLLGGPTGVSRPIPFRRPD